MLLHARMLLYSWMNSIAMMLMRWQHSFSADQVTIWLVVTSGKCSCDPLPHLRRVSDYGR